MAGCQGREHRSGSVTASTRRSSIWATTNRWSAWTTTAHTTARTAANTSTTSVVRSLSSGKAGSTFVLSPNTVGGSSCTERERRSLVGAGCHPNLHEGRESAHSTTLVQKSATEAAVLNKLVLRRRFGRTIGVYVRNLGSLDERATVRLLR